MRKIISRIAALAVIIAACLFCGASVAAEFTRSEKLCAIRMTYPGLAATLRSTIEFLNRANDRVEFLNPTQILNLTGPQEQLELKDTIDSLSMSQGPQVANELRYAYRTSPSVDAPISGVILSLGDFRRTLTVSGTDKQQVDALVYLVSNDLSRNGCTYSGTGLRFFLYFFGFASGLVLAGVASTMTAPIATRAFTFMCAAGMIAFAVLLLTDGEAWFPGTYVGVTAPSWFERNTPLLTYVGLLSGFIPLLLQLRGLKSKSKPKQ